MKILHIVPSFYPAIRWGGPIYSVHGLCNALATISGITLKVLTTDAAGPLLTDRVPASPFPACWEPGYEVFYCRRLWGASGSPGMLLRIPRLIRWADVVHLTAVYSAPTLPVLLACRLAEKPLIWSPRGALYNWSGARRKFLKRAWIALCRRLRPKRTVIHCTSEKEAAESGSRFPGVPTSIVANGVNIPERPKKYESVGGRPLRLIYMGLISPVKALDRLIRAIALVDNVELNIFGQPAMGYEAYGESVRMLVANLGVERRVTFKGFVREEEKESAFHGADVCVVPSHSENFSNVVAEALAHAVPVIVSKGAPWSRIEDKRCGLWVDNDPESLAEALIQIRSMDLGAMGVRGREWVRAEYSWNLVGRRIFDEYLSLVSHS